MTTQPAPRNPYKLMTVNTVPARAKIIIGRVVEALKDRYTIDYVANSESRSLSAPNFSLSLSLSSITPARIVSNGAPISKCS